MQVIEEILKKETGTPASQEAIEEAERNIGFSFPPLLRQIYEEVGNGGIGPGLTKDPAPLKALAATSKAAQAPPRPATRSSPGRAAPRASAERSGRLPAAPLGGRRRDLEPAPHPRGGLSVAKLCTQCTKKEPLVT